MIIGRVVFAENYDSSKKIIEFTPVSYTHLNASNNQTGQNITINVKNSTLVAERSDHDTAAILFNIPGTLNLSLIHI